MVGFHEAAKCLAIKKVRVRVCACAECNTIYNKFNGSFTLPETDFLRTWIRIPVLNKNRKQGS